MLALVVKNSPTNARDRRDAGLILESSRKWQPAPVFLPGKVHGQWSLAGCRGATKSQMRLSTTAHASKQSRQSLWWRLSGYKVFLCTLVASIIIIIFIYIYELWEVPNENTQDLPAAVVNLYVVSGLQPQSRMWLYLLVQSCCTYKRVAFSTTGSNMLITLNLL